MDLFVLDRTTWAPPVTSNPDELVLGDIKGVEKVSWVERFKKPGEFTIVGEPAKLMKTLPIGSFVSHAMSNEVMVVENYFIDESKGKTPKLVATGRSLPAHIMDERVVSFNQELAPGDIWTTSGIANLSTYPMQYETDYVYSWEIVYRLIRDHLQTTTAGDAEDLPNFFAAKYGLIDYDEWTGIKVTKRLKYLSDVVYEILEGADVGLKAVRPGPERADIERSFIDQGYSFGALDPNECMMFVVYRGQDLSESVIFNYNDGDLHNARYSWSIRDKKNAYYSGNLTHTYRHYDTDITGWDTKVALVDANDYIPPGGASDDDIKKVLESRGVEAITKDDLPVGMLLDAIGSNKVGSKYLINYQLGDIVGVFGNYGVNNPMRVIEVATIQDGENEVNIPTMAPVFNTVHITPG